MKYLKTYETKESYKSGDIIIANFKVWDINGKPQSYNILRDKICHRRSTQNKEGKTNICVLSI